MPEEIRRQIPGYEGLYDVTSEGRVISCARRDVAGKWLKEKDLRQTHNATSRPSVQLYKDYQVVKKTVHALVALTFIGPRPAGADICHWDDDPFNNRASNLRYASRTENLLDSVRNGKHYWANKTHCKRGHALIAPNLVPHKLKLGHRNCLACKRAHYRKNPDKRFSRIAADKQYIEIMTGVGR